MTKAVTQDKLVREQSIHLAVRFADSLFDIRNVVERHTEVLRQHGRVWLGKFGAPPGRATIDTLNSQISDGHITWVWLLSSGAGGRRVYRGEIESVSHSVPEREGVLVPRYYVER